MTMRAAALRVLPLFLLLAGLAVSCGWDDAAPPLTNAPLVASLAVDSGRARGREQAGCLWHGVGFVSQKDRGPQVGPFLMQSVHV